LNLKGTNIYYVIEINEKSKDVIQECV